jgi:hypothetical protein
VNGRAGWAAVEAKPQCLLFYGGHDAEIRLQPDYKKRPQLRAFLFLKCLIKKIRSWL